MKKLEEEALRLGQNDRAELARILLLSLDAPGDQDVETEWAEESERRYQEIKSGAVQPIPSEVVFEEAWSKLK